MQNNDEDFSYFKEMNRYQIAVSVYNMIQIDVTQCRKMTSQISTLSVFKGVACLVVVFVYFCRLGC